ncbi:MAG: hypothetical protein IT162_05785 [Bryobacterales bacterium]|nr:hypothetical protein [Bryobacterales bacterium]
MLASFEKLLKLAPYSRLRPEATVTVLAVSYAEPPLMEKRLDTAPDPAEVIAICREFDNPDCAYQLDTYWDLWSRDEQTGEWKLGPASLCITCYAPMFESELGEQLLIDFGLDSRFLPEGDTGAELMAVRSNVRSLLHLTTDAAKNLAVEKKTLWSESGENLAARLAATLSDLDASGGRA